MTVIVAPEAARDLSEIYAYIFQERPRAADQTLDRLVSTFERLDDSELRGPVTQLRNGRRAQRWSVPPYRIYYRRTADQTVILRVYHQARRPIER